MKNASLNSKQNPLARLGALSAQHPELAPYLTREMALRARRFMKGVTLYRNNPFHREETDMPILWRSGTTTLRDYAPLSPHAPIILVVPSLINRFTILDLLPHHSFLRMLALHGFRPLVIDWDRPGDTEKDFTLGDYVTKRLMPALSIAATERPIHLLGYCMGGALSLALASLCPQHVRTLSLLATPWDFHAGYQATGQSGTILEEKLQPWLRIDDLLPIEVVQSVFTSFQPLHAFRKFSSFADMDPSGLDAKRFIATEDWLNDGIPLTAPAARECFGDWCTRNVTSKGEWRVGNQIIDPHKLTLPSYVVVPGKDRIVPPESSMPLAHALTHAVRHEPMMGHIGIMAGAQALHQVWVPLTKWLGSH